MKLSIHRLRRAIIIFMLGLPAAFGNPSEALKLSYHEGEYIFPLGWLNGGDRAPIELRGAEARKTFKLSVPARLGIDEARLEMVYTNSISMLPRSQLAVTLDDRVIAQLPVKAHQPDNAARIVLPMDAFRPGYREIGFRAAQHYTNECEDPSSPELYSQIDAVHSILRLKTSRRPITSSLARLTDIFDRRLWMERYTLELMVPRGSLAQDEDMRQAVMEVSQAVAAMFNYLPVSIRVNELAPSPTETNETTRHFPGVPWPKEAWDAVLLGTRDQLAGLVSPKILNTIREGYIGLFQSDQDPTRAILLISGVTPAQVRQAATALNLPGIALPDRADVSVSELELDQGYRQLQPLDDEEGWTSLANLGFETTTLKGMYPTPARVQFWVSRDMLNPAVPTIELELNLAYGAGFDRKSGLNVFFNDQFAAVIPMQNKHGEQLFRQKIKIPTVSLRMGLNELKFVPTMTGLDLGGECVPIYTENLLVSILEDSRIELPPIADYMNLPDLGLLGHSGLPYNRAADGHGIGVILANMEPDTLGSALSLAAKLRQINKAPLSSMRLLASTDSLERLNGLIVVGPEHELPKTLREEAVAFMPRQRWQQFTLGTQRTTDLEQGFKRWIEHPEIPLLAQSKSRKAAAAKLTLDEGLGASAALIQYISPSMRIPVTILTAAQSDRLWEGTQQLIEHPTWAALDGSAMLWTMDGENIARAYPPPEEQEFIGEKSNIPLGSKTLSDATWLLILVTLATILLAATLSWWLLRQRARRLATGE